LSIDPFFKKLGIVIVALFVIGIFGMATSPRCPGCGKIWSGTSTMKYCFACQAIQAQGSASNKKTCAYDNCPDYVIEGSKYCYRHTCSVDGCYNQANENTMFKYCNKHQSELTCAVDGCHADRYRDSIYCNMHYPDGK